MQAMLVLLALAAPALALHFDTEDAKVRPVTKVVNLLQGMKQQLEKEAEEEAELMEKHNCWCKENADTTSTTVEEGTAKIKELESKVSSLSALSSRLKVEVKNTQADIQKAEEGMDEAMALRKQEVAKFQEAEKDELNNLNAVHSAQQTIEGSSFLQKPTALSQKLRDLYDRSGDKLSSESSAKLTNFLQNPATGEIAGVMQGLESDFTANLKHLREEEAKHKSDYATLMKAQREEIDSMKIQVASKNEQQATADEDRVQAKQDIKDLNEEIGDAAALAKEVKEKCFGKEKAWEQRQKTRAAETEAVVKAIEVLSNDDAKDVFSKTMNPSFLQLSEAARSEDVRRADAAAVLDEAGKKDSRLATLALEAKIDTFERVKEKVDLMVAALKKEQSDEVRKKEYCLEELQENRMDTEKKQRNSENLAAKQEELKMKMADATEKMKALETDIAEMKKQQKLAAQNREKENAEFQRVVQEQRQTQDLLKKALTVLGEFYKKPALIQDPKTFGDYKKSTSSNGVMLMLQQLIADAKEMETESVYAEHESQEDYEAFGKELTASIESSSKAMTDKAEEKAKAESSFIMTRESGEGVKAEIERLQDTGFQLHETCDWSLQNFDARQKARSDEMEALKQAKAYLSGAKLLQK
eukprot:CAMPEP_0197636506 /NCGR_PEP_ID=MMETSP1338-20131121/11986_1 /TAXON_ID=43686 ORGANISM="Pelagodinium beii, Strain RCC1491" /NCGR_SAMPLE_ID=MMETSP1338 /ASSEMBLY_ACC=CAM_ASM_000754 /LENGTH=642 /DNA_ID=CAMNT_0043208743 /DNA_START=58 /DNA_END=1986 /DNA_ORIENTATION=-